MSVSLRPSLFAAGLNPAGSGAARPAPPGYASVRVVYNNDPHEKLQAMPHVVGAFDHFSREGQSMGRDVLRLNGGDNNIGIEPMEWGLNVAMMNLIRYHAAVMGNHELDIGSRLFSRGLSFANFPVLVSNLEIHPKSGIADMVKAGHIKTRPVIVRDRQGTYGIIGITTPRLHDVLSPKAPLEGCDVEDYEDTVEEVREQVRELEKKGINKIFLLSHMDTEHDRKLVTEDVDGIDFVLSAHDHKAFHGIVPERNLLRSKRGEPVLMVEAGKNSAWVGVADVLFDEQGRIVPEFNCLHNPFKFPADPRAVAIKNAVLGPPHMLATILTAHDTTNNAFEPDPIAMFTADAMRAMSGADIAFVRSPEVRNNINPGIFTDQMLAELMPFQDPVVRLRLTGAEIWRALDQSANCLKDNETHPGMLHPSGLSVRMNRTTGEVEAVYLYNRQSARWEFMPPDARTYTVAIGEFTVLNKREFANLAHPERIEWNSGKPVREFFRLGLQMSGAPNRPIAFQHDGRLQIV